MFGPMTTERRKLPVEITLMEVGIKPAWERRRNLARGLIPVLKSGAATPNRGEHAHNAHRQRCPSTSTPVAPPQSSGQGSPPQQTAAPIHACQAGHTCGRGSPRPGLRPTPYISNEASCPEIPVNLKHLHAPRCHAFWPHSGALYQPGLPAGKTACCTVQGQT